MSIATHILVKSACVLTIITETRLKTPPSITSMEHFTPIGLTDISICQVRKTSQAALLVLLEQGLVEKSDVEQQVCPVIITFTEADSLDDYRTEAVALLSKMAPMIGREMSERLFLDRFAALCLDPLFHVRKVCAANFGDFSGVVGPESTEKILLPKFFYLCEDGVWGVRKACADVFMPVSCVCSPTIRQTELSPIFINLLTDQSRWVRMAAFQALGPFISTFADPAITALLHNENGEIIITDPDQLADRLNSLELTRQQQKQSSPPTATPSTSTSSTLTSTLENCINNNTGEARSSSSTTSPEEDESGSTAAAMEVSEEEDNAWSSQMVATSSPKSAEERRATAYYETHATDTKAAPTNFDTFLYWREPVLDLVDLDDASELENVRTQLSYLDSESSTDQTTSEGTVEAEKETSKEEEKSKEEKKAEEEEKAEEEAASGSSTPESASDNGSQEGATMEMFRSGSDKEMTDNISTFDPQNRWGSSSSLHSSRSSLDSRTADLAKPDPALSTLPPKVDQSIVPQLLIDHYVSMIDPSRAQTVDNDIARHCAFSLPAVALTLGRSNWPLLKETYETLASDMQWKVRRTLASSIHELGVILGEEVASQDLVPIFNGFIKDLDEVRIGMLKHLADFLKLLEDKERNEYLPKLEEFLKMDNERNWRFRLELSEQLGLLVPLFKADNVKTYLAPIALKLIQDKVAAVRISATAVMSNMIQTDEAELTSYLLAQLAEKSAHSPYWNRRQTFGVLCSALINSIPYSKFSQDLLPHLLDLTWDRVPNVRMQVARVLGQDLPDELFEDSSLSSRELIVSALEQLAGDKDADVREAAAARLRVQPNPPIKVKVQEEEDQHHQGGEGVADPETAAPPTEGEEAGNSGEENSPSWATIVAKYQ